LNIFLLNYNIKTKWAGSSSDLANNAG